MLIAFTRSFTILKKRIQSVDIPYYLRSKGDLDLNVSTTFKNIMTTDPNMATEAPKIMVIPNHYLLQHFNSKTDEILTFFVDS